MYMPFREGAQIWVNQRGASIARSAGESVEGISHDMVLDDVDKMFTRAFERARGYHLSAGVIVDKMIKEARNVETSSTHSQGWSDSYTFHLIDVLSQAWRLTDMYKARLRFSIHQRRLPDF